MLDGVLAPLDQTHLPVTDPAITVGWSVFETMRAADGQVARLPAHLERLSISSEAACVPMPDRVALEAQIAAVVEACGGEGRIRVTITGAGRVLVVGTELPVGRAGRPVRAVRGPHRDEPFLAGRVKHGSRAPWVVAVARAGVDEVLLVDESGRFTEGTTSAIVAVLDGVLWSAADDGRILPSTTVADLLAHAQRLEIPVRREGAMATGPWDGLYIASATRRLSPVVELDGVELPGWEPIGRRLFDEEGW